MSTTAKVVWGIVVLAVIVGGWWWMNSSNTAVPAGDNAAVNGNTNTTGTSPTAGSGNSDADLTQASANLDAQMSGLNSDNAAVNQTDQPVQQSY